MLIGAGGAAAFIALAQMKFGGGLVGTLDLMRTAADDDAWFLIGDIFWQRQPADAVALGVRSADDHGDFDVLGRLSMSL